MSFGWVFWHRTCYGCLLCGCKILYQGLNVKDLFEDTRGGGAREVEETPLCANCVVEIEVDEVADDEVLQTGLQRIEKADGGLTRERHGLKGRERAATVKRVPKQGVDGANSDGSDTTTLSRVQPPDTIWINLSDPIDGPVFKPSPLKPVPRFMQRPNWVNVDTPGPQTTQNPKFNLALPPRAIVDQSSDSGPSTICASGPRTPVPPRSSSKSPSKAVDTPHPEIPTAELDKLEDLDYFSSVEPLKPLTFRRKPAYINEEPLQRPSSRLMAPHRRSETHASAYLTPPETSEDFEHIERSGTAAAPRCSNPRKPSTPAASQIALQLHRLMKAGTPAQSTTSVNSTKRSRSPSIHMSRATTEAKTDTSGSTTSLRSTAKTRSKEGSVRRSVGVELRRFFTGKDRKSVV